MRIGSLGAAPGRSAAAIRGLFPLSARGCAFAESGCAARDDAAKPAQSSDRRGESVSFPGIGCASGTLHVRVTWAMRILATFTDIMALARSDAPMRTRRLKTSGKVQAADRSLVCHVGAGRSTGHRMASGAAPESEPVAALAAIGTTARCRATAAAAPCAASAAMSPDRQGKRRLPGDPATIRECRSGTGGRYAGT